MSVDADKKLAARCFGTVGGAFAGFGAAAVRFGWELPPEAGGAAVFVLLGGALAFLLGVVASYISASLVRTSRLAHVLRWVLVPAVLAFGAGCWWFDTFG